MNKTITSVFVALCAMIGGISIADTITFDKIPLNQETYSTEDPLGVSAIKQAETNIDELETNVSQASSTANQAKAKADELETQFSTIDQRIGSGVDSKIHGENVAIGQYKGSTNDVAMQAKDNSIVIAANRDMSDVGAEENSIVLSANKIKLDATTSQVYIGSQTLQELLAHRGEENVIEQIWVNGTKVEPEDKVVKLTIPSVPIREIKVNEETITPEDGVVSLTIPTEVGETNIIETVKVNGTALTVTDKSVNIEVPSVEGFLTLETLRVYDIHEMHDAATNVITKIDAAEDISQIKDALKEFFGKFKKPE